MKKVKIMLMSAIVIAAVGGALAFKAKAVIPFLYCTDDPNATCPVQKIFTFEGANQNNFVSYCSTTISPSEDCTYAVPE